MLSDMKLTILNSTHDPQLFPNADFHLKIKLKNEKRIVEIINNL